jgi:hypothetical protein
MPKSSSEDRSDFLVIRGQIAASIAAQEFPDREVEQRRQICLLDRLYREELLSEGADGAVRALPELLREWSDFDEASFILAKGLGLMPQIPWNPGDKTAPGASMKAAFWSSNLFGEGLARLLQELTKMGALQCDEEGPAYRWNPEFDWEPTAQQPDDPG